MVFQSSGYRETVLEIKEREEAEKRAAVRKAKEERKRMRREKVKSRIRCLFKKKA